MRRRRSVRRARVCRLLDMNLARHRAATRNAVFVAVVGSLFLAAVGRAESQVELILPLVRAMAFGVAAARASTPQQVAPGPFSARIQGRPLTFLPKALQIPDGYDIEYDFGTPRYMTPVGRDRIVSYDLLPRARRGWMASIAYDEESHRPIQGTGDVIRLLFHK